MLGYITAGVVAIVIVLFHVYAPTTDAFPIPIIYDYYWLSLFAAALAAAVAPYALREYRAIKWMMALEAQIPQALRIISDGVSSGLELSTIMRILSTMNMRPMNELAANVLRLVTIGGLSVDDALMRAAREVKSLYFRRFAVLLVEAYRSGARISDVLNMAARSFAAVIEYRRERISQLRPYVILIYGIVLVYVIISAILVHLLVPEVSRIGEAPGELPGVQIGATVTEGTIFGVLLVYMGLIQSAFGALIAGKVVYSRPTAGLLHAVALLPLVAVGIGPLPMLVSQLV